jgi:hypothetical protein
MVRAAAHDFYGPDRMSEPLEPQDFQYLERTFYDFNDNEVLKQVEDRGNTSGVDENPLITDLPAFLILLGGTSTGGNTQTTLNDTTQTWMPNQWAGRTVQIISGTGVGQVRTITGNTDTQLTLATPWGTIPDTTSRYSVLAIRNPTSTAFIDTVFQ